MHNTKLPILYHINPLWKLQQRHYNKISRQKNFTRGENHDSWLRMTAAAFLGNYATRATHTNYKIIRVSQGCFYSFWFPRSQFPQVLSPLRENYASGSLGMNCHWNKMWPLHVAGNAEICKKKFKILMRPCHFIYLFIAFFWRAGLVPEAQEDTWKRNFPVLQVQCESNTRSAFSPVKGFSFFAASQITLRQPMQSWCLCPFKKERGKGTQTSTRVNQLLPPASAPETITLPLNVYET